MTNLSFILLFIMAVFFQGCALSVLMPGSLSQPPVVSKGLLKGDVKLSLEKNVEIKVFDDITTNPPTRPTDDSGSLSVTTLFPYLPDVTFGLGLGSNVDIYFTGHTGLRWQFLDSKWKSTVFAGYGSRTSKLETTCNSNLNCNGEVALKTIEGGLSVGYEVSNDTILYVTVGTQRGTAESKVTQPSNQFSYSDKVEHDIASLGILAGEQLYVNAEISYVNNKWSSDNFSKTTTATTSQIGLGYRW